VSREPGGIYRSTNTRKGVSEVCKIFGISRKTYYKWRRNDFGKKSVHYVPFKGQPNLKITKEIGSFIKEKKDLTNYGPLKMKYLVKRELGIDLSTTIIYRYYKRRNLSESLKEDFLGTNQ